MLDSEYALKALLSQDHILWRIETRHEATLLLCAIYKSTPAARDRLTTAIIKGPPQSVLQNDATGELGDHLVFDVLQLFEN